MLLPLMMPLLLPLPLVSRCRCHLDMIRRCITPCRYASCITRDAIIETPLFCHAADIFAFFVARPLLV